MNYNFEINQLVYVQGIPATIEDIQIHDSEPDYLLRPVAYPLADFCRCGAKDCGGVAWFRKTEFTSKIE